MATRVVHTVDDHGSPRDPAEQARPFSPVFTVLDPLRAVGALAVVTTHATFWTGDYLRHGVYGAILARLDVGVAIFFVLSGFLLSHHVLARAARGIEPEPVRRYFLKRFLRIYPAYLVAVLLAMVFVKANADAGVRDWATVLLMGDIYVGDSYRAGLTQMWSLATEVSFYLVLPLLMLVVTGGRRGRPTTSRVVVLLAGMAAVNVLWTLELEGRAEDALPAGIPGNWLPSYLLWFGAGIGLAWAHLRHQQGVAQGRPVAWTAPFATLGRAPGACWTIALGLLVVAATPLGGPTMLAPATTTEALTKQVIYGAIGLLLVITGVFNDHRSRYSTVMSHPLPRHLGHLSYAVFCLHLVVLHFVMWVTPYDVFVGTNGPQVLGLTLLITLPLAELLYRFVELPAMRLRGPGRPARANVSDIASSTRP